MCLVCSRPQFNNIFLNEWTLKCIIKSLHQLFRLSSLCCDLNPFSQFLVEVENIHWKSIGKRRSLLELELKELIPSYLCYLITGYFREIQALRTSVSFLIWELMVFLGKGNMVKLNHRSTFAHDS